MSSLSNKIIIVGDGNVGKTQFVNIYKSDFSIEYTPTNGVEISKVKFNTANNIVTLNIWDCGGSMGHKGLEDCYYVDADAAIVMFDFTNLESFKNVASHIKNIKRVCEDNIPIIICGNKYEEEHCISKTELSKFIRSTRYSYYNMSVKTLYNTFSPFSEIIKKYYKKEELYTIDLEYSISSQQEDREKCYCTIL